MIEALSEVRWSVVPTKSESMSIVKYKSLSKFHRNDKNHICQGNVTVTRGTKLGWLLAQILGLPKSIENGTVTVEMNCGSNGIEHWKRRFYTKDGKLKSIFYTRQTISEESLLETFGPFGMDLLYFLIDLKADKENRNRFDFILKDFGIRIPILGYKFPCLNV